MTCDQFKTLRVGKNLFDMSAAERDAMRHHFETCGPCHAETEELAERNRQRGRKRTPEEDAELDRLVRRDLNDPECQR